MKLSLDWIQEWISLESSPEQVCQELTMLGLEAKVFQKEPFPAIEIEIPPNRGDCASALGIARELAALYGRPLFNVLSEQMRIHLPEAKAFFVHQDVLKACSIYQLQEITLPLNSDVVVPQSIQDRLQLNGIDRIHPVVDLLNYTLLNIGQPLHAFDADEIKGQIVVRFAHSSEPITLLNGKSYLLRSDTLIVADEEGPLAIAGVLGSNRASISKNTRRILIESAWFSPQHLVGKARSYHIQTESAYRFERGVDPSKTEAALVYAINLLERYLFEGHVSIKQHFAFRASNHEDHRVLLFDPKSVAKLLGGQWNLSDVAFCLEKIGVHITPIESDRQDVWKVFLPPHRLDLQESVDLIEEVVRFKGFQLIDSSIPSAPVSFENRSSLSFIRTLKRRLCAKGFQEIISYPFSDPKKESLWSSQKLIQILNPIQADRAVLRTTLFSGLLDAASHYFVRQQKRIRLFEVGACFRSTEENRWIAGVCQGAAKLESWRNAHRVIDFFDLKEAILFMLGALGTDLPVKCVSFLEEEHLQKDLFLGLDPQCSASLYLGEQRIGRCGAFSSMVCQAWDLKKGPWWGFELHLEALPMEYKPVHYEAERHIKFPMIRRDMSLLVPKDVSAGKMYEEIKRFANAFESEFMLWESTLFDCYESKSLPEGYFGASIGLIFCHASGTLRDQQVDTWFKKCLEHLGKHFGVSLRMEKKI